MDDALTQQEHERWLATLAGLLHDVGKLAQRAGWMKGKHTEVGAEFVHRYVPEQWRDKLYAVAGHHEHPLEGHRNRVVALADRLSAAEREEAAAAAPKQLIAILGRTAVEGRPASEGQAASTEVWPLKPLALAESVLMPEEPVGLAEELAGYRLLWDTLVADVTELPDDDLPSYVTGLYYALQRTTWCVPGAYYYAAPDVSLFDHSRTTAALAACLVDLDDDALDSLLPHPQGDRPLVLLVGGDISGVQKFIYTITARGAAKGLRGRSFYLQALTEAIARYVLRRLKLPPTNLIYASGGHFYLLAPAGTDGTLETVRAEISRKLLAHHGGDLYLALGWATVTADQFDRELFYKRWEAVIQATSAAKRQRFAELDDADELLDQVFGPTGSGGDDENECQVCHYEGPDVRHEDDRDETSRRICALCTSLEALGTALRDADFLLLGEVTPEETARGGYAAALRSFGTVIGFTSAGGHAVLKLPTDTTRATLLAMRDQPNVAATAARIAGACRCPVAPGTRYTVNVTPRVADEDISGPDWDRYLKTLEDQAAPRPGDVKEFGLMQAQAQGVRQLGVLRMDVDDLGDMFKWGMKTAGTLSRVASLSFALSLFFEGWVGELCRKVNAEGLDEVYAIYSGGDDLFIVGAWDVLPELADTIRRDLARFAAGNPAIHISGGLTLHGGKYPLYQAAADADDALDKAKDHVRKDGDRHHKDALNFLGITIPWEDFENLQQTQSMLRELVDAGVKRSLLRTLLTLYDGYIDATKDRGKPYWGPLMWRGAYTFKRMAGQHKEHKAAIEAIGRQLDFEHFQSIETLGPAARWAELLIRKEQTE